MKLKQNQIWNLGDGYILITHLERLEVQYKTFKNISNRKGAHHHVSKKEFCRLIKHAILLSAEDIATARLQSPVDDSLPIVVDKTLPEAVLPEADDSEGAESAS